MQTQADKTSAEQEDVDDSSSQHTASCTCLLCKKSISTKGLASAVKCEVCAGGCHMGCLVNAFVASNGGSLKTSLQWLADFLKAGNFHYVCSSCVMPSKQQVNGNSTRDSHCSQQSAVDLQQDVSHLHKEIATLQSSLTAMSGSIGQISKQMDDIKSSFNIVDSPASLTSSETNASKSPMTYAGVVSKTVAESIKKVVTDSMKDHENRFRNKSSAVIYGLPSTRLIDVTL